MLKTVLMPIRVPSGNYCWSYDGSEMTCPRFDNEGGHPNCTIGFYPVKDTKAGVLKATDCSRLKEDAGQ